MLCVVCSGSLATMLGAMPSGERGEGSFFSEAFALLAFPNFFGGSPDSRRRSGSSARSLSALAIVNTLGGECSSERCFLRFLDKRTSIMDAAVVSPNRTMSTTVSPNGSSNGSMGFTAILGRLTIFRFNEFRISSKSNRVHA